MSLEAQNPTYLETARHRAEIPKNLVPVLAEIAIRHRIDPNEKGWETEAVKVILQALHYQGFTIEQFAGAMKGRPAQLQPAHQPAPSPFLSLNLSP